MAKEIIKENVMEAPTLFVGVGGTGSGIVKMVAEMCRPGERENVNFVCLDTNVNDLSNIAKSKAKIYYVQTSNTQTVGNYLDYDKDALNNWFPKNAVLYDKTVSEGAGQVRAISRLALNSTIKLGKINPLYNAIDDLFRKTGRAMKQVMRVVIASTASGGTGSGIMLPLAMFIRDYVNRKYPNTSLIIRALVLLPETLDKEIKSTVEKESQRRNAYATIKEINAFMMKGSGFFDIDGDLSRYSNLHVDFPVAGTDELRPLSLLPFDFCFLLDGQNAEDSTLVNLNQYMKQAAQALFEQNIGPMQKKAFSVEDNIIKEMSNPGNYGRNRFGGIGASTLRYPYDDVADYIAYDWAIDSIGGEGETAKWLKYDNAYEIYKREAQKKGVSQSEAKTRAQVYIEKLNDGEDSFSKDLRGMYLSDADDRIDEYFTALADEMHEAVATNSKISAAADAANELASKINYENENKKGRAVTNLGYLRNYESVVRQNAENAARSVAESMFYNETKTVNENAAYKLEYLLKNSYGEIIHPNAARYMLYRAKIEMDERVETTQSAIRNEVEQVLRLYSSRASNPGKFDVKFTKKEAEENLDQLCAAEKNPDEIPALLKKFGTYDSIYETLNQIFPAYYRAIKRLGDLTAELVAYRCGSEYLDAANKMFERFYGTFSEKVSALLRKKEETVDYLKFNKGDSLYNVCATGAMLEELSYSTKSARDDSSMLEPELNGQIYDAVKANVTFEREIRFADIVEVDRRIDIFDDILLGYFKEDVRRNCENIDVNIIEAMAMENRLQARIKLREQQTDRDAQIIDTVTSADNIRHITETIAMGKRLAAPGIQRITNEEAREVRLCAYNRVLNDMRAFRIGDLISADGEVDGVDTDTVSKYELRFFNALYNLTPDKLNKFASPNKSETGTKNAGLYHNAYISYSKNIGPDSTKNMMISTHIDKRWDSISVMPELDFDFQNRQMMKIHQAMIYGLIHKVITYRKLSSATSGKMVYKYENSEERFEDMVVSNGTLCDEFYEILDALYISSAIVEDIGVTRDKKRARDKVRNSNYGDTAFAKDLEDFNLPFLHEGKTSLFEIPLAYYNSLPNSIRFTSEITALVDAVIKTFGDELALWEKPEDAKFELCNILKDQFMLLMDNYAGCDKLSLNTPSVDNEILDIIYRRIKKVIEVTPEPDDYESILEEMKARIRAC